MVIERDMRVTDKNGNILFVVDINKELNEVVLSDSCRIIRLTRTFQDFVKEFTDCVYTYNGVEFTLVTMGYGIVAHMEGIEITFDKDFFDEKKAMRTVKRYIDTMEDAI